MTDTIACAMPKVNIWEKFYSRVISIG